jgi:hypothetical protein
MTMTRTFVQRLTLAAQSPATMRWRRAAGTATLTGDVWHQAWITRSAIRIITVA